MSEQIVADDFVGSLTEESIEAAYKAVLVKNLELMLADSVSKAASSEFLRINKYSAEFLEATSVKNIAQRARAVADVMLDKASTAVGSKKDYWLAMAEKRANYAKITEQAFMDLGVLGTQYLIMLQFRIQKPILEKSS